MRRFAPSQRDTDADSANRKKRGFFRSRSTRRGKQRDSTQSPNDENQSGFGNVVEYGRGSGNSREDASRSRPTGSLANAGNNSNNNVVPPEEDRVVHLTSIGNDHFARGEYDAALRLYDEVLRLASGHDSNSYHSGSTGGSGSSWNSVTKKNRSIIARIMINIGAVHIQRNDLDKAIHVLQKAFRQAEALSASASHAHSQHGLDIFAGSEDDIRFKADSITADILQNIGLVNLRQGKYDRALSTYKEALTMRRKCIGYLREQERYHTVAKESMDECKLELADVLNSIGLINQKLEVHTAAIQAFREALELRRAALSDPSHQLITAVLSSLGHAYLNMDDKYEDALKCMEDVLKIRKEKLGPWHIDIADALNGVAIARLRLGRLDESLSASLEAVGIAGANTSNNKSNNNNKERGTGFSEDADSLKLATAMNNLGLVYEKMERIDDALLSFKEALKIRLEILGEDHLTVASCVHNMANLYCEKGEYDEAMVAFKQSLRSKEMIYGRYHPSIATTLGSIGTCHMWKGEYTRAIRYHTKAITIWEKVLGTTSHPNIADSLNNCGVALKRKGEYTEAMENFTSALRMYREAGVKPDHAGVVSVIRNIADFEHSRINLEE